jgi:hypothetical protein
MPDSPANQEMQGLINDLDSGVITEEELKANWDDAKHGTMGAKRQTAQMAAQLQQAQADKARAEAELARMRAQNQTPGALDQASQRRINEKAAEGENEESADSRSRAVERVEKMVEEKFPRDKRPGGGFFGGGQEAQEEWDAKRSIYQQKLEKSIYGNKGAKNGKVPKAKTGGGFSTEQRGALDGLKARFESGEISREQLMQELEDLGIDPSAPQPE